jgi:hypothetical protein
MRCGFDEGDYLNYIDLAGSFLVSDANHSVQQSIQHEGGWD